MEGSGDNRVFWRVEGSLVDLGVLRPVAFFTGHAHAFTERWARRISLTLVWLLWPLVSLAPRAFSLRLLHALLSGVSRDRLDLLGEEYFHYYLQPQLKRRGLEELQRALAGGGELVLVSAALEHLVRPLAQHLGVSRFVANRLDFRDGRATGRLLDPVLRPPNGWGVGANGRVPFAELARELGSAAAVLNAGVPAERRLPVNGAPLVVFDRARPPARLSVRGALRGRHILLVGATGFIGKVWLAQLLTDLPELGRIYLLIRRQRSVSAERRFEKMLEESPVFESLYERHGNDFLRFIRERVEVVAGDVTRSDLGLEPGARARLERALDLVVNSSGLTDFNPGLRDGLDTNVDAALHLVEFVRRCDHAALLHLSSCYAAGARDGRVGEELRPNYTPHNVPDFDAERELESLRRLIRETEARSSSAEVTEELRRLAREKRARGKAISDAALESHISRYRARWLHSRLTEAGTRRARELGWPNSYTFTKGLAESLLEQRGAGLRLAIVRPSIVETSLAQPFRGWNEGINTSAPLSYLLGTYFRQLPSNERKCLDLIPVDTVCRGMTLVAAALVESCHRPVYQFATSANNPCDMRRSIELTSLAHRKHYRAQGNLELWLRAQFDAIPVSKKRYQAFSAPGQKALIQGLKLLASSVPLLRMPLEKRERALERVEKLIELYEPFILHNEQVFEAQNIELLSAALPAEEKAAFGYDSASIDWWDYWINVHVPALRKWVYPLIEGRPLEARPRRNLQPVAAPAAAGSSARP